MGGGYLTQPFYHMAPRQTMPYSTSDFGLIASPIAALVFGATQHADAAGDIFDGYIQINGTWYNIGGVNDGRNNPSGSANASSQTLLSNVDFGTQTLGSFNITGFQINAWTSFGTSAANNGANYKVWRAGDAEPGYTNFWDTGTESYYSGSDYVSSTTGQSTGIIGDTFINGDTYNLKFQTYTVQTGDNAGTKFYERSDSFVVNGARQLITGTSNTTQSAAYNTSASGGIVKQGTGSLFLTKDNSNASTGQKGTIYIDEGTLAVNPDGGVSGNNALGGSSAVVQLGATGGSANANFSLADSDGGLSISRSIFVRGGSSGTKTISSTNSSGTNTLSSLISLDNNVTLSSASGGTFELSGNLEDGLATGSFGVAIAGSGKVVFSGASNNTGVTGYTVNNGATLSMNKSSADSVQSTLTIDSGGTAEFAASNQLGASASIVNNGTLATGSGSLTDSFASLSSSGTISGNGTLTASTYTLSGGTVNANLGAGTLNITGNVALNGTSGANSVAITGGNLTLGSGANRLSSSADVTISASRSLTIAGNQTVASIKETATSDGGTIAIGSGAILTVNGANKGSLFQNSISGLGGLTVNGSGNTTLSLYGTQSYSGATRVSGAKLSTGVALGTSVVTIDGGTFETSAADILGDSASVNLSSGTYALGGNDTIGSLTISGGSLTGSSTLTAATYALNGGTVSANLGAGSLSVGGSSTLNGTSAATTVNVSTGTLSLGGSNRLATGASVSLAAGTGLNLGANSQQLAGLTGDGTVTTSASGSLNLNIASGSSTFAGGIGGAGGLTKSGNGTLFLSGSNSLTGATNVSAGTLRVNGSVGGDATVASGATLGGTGTISGAVNVTGILSPGASIESLAVGSTSFNTGSTFEWEFNSSSLTADLLDVTGNLNLTGTVGLNLIDLASSSIAITEGTKFSLISYTGSWNSGTFSGYADDSVFKIGVNDWKINYNDITGGGNFSSEQSGAAGFVTMTVVPEPSAAALTLFAGGLLATRRRRKA
jgi:autotransporter-associated beta strand protein